MTSRKPRSLRPEEKELWEKVRHSAVPLHRSGKQMLVEAIEEVTRQPQHFSLPRFQIGQAQNPKPVPEPTSRAVDIQMDAKKFGRLKRGKVVPEARIDLHGMTVAQAYPELVGFIINAHSKGLRLVLVITGKGRTKASDGPIPVRIGVLKRQVPEWLRQAPLNPAVQQVTEAHSKHGGSGALYVYLRRRR